jgi:hypothetical protein
VTSSIILEKAKAVNDYAQVGRLSSFLVIMAGLLICFCGYRILKVSLGIIGFIAGAFGGWQLGLSLANNSAGIALACALVGGVVGMALCVFVYLLGIFLLGATAGAVVAAAFFSGIGHQIQPVIFLALPIAFGVIALLVQKFMIIVSTAFSGSYFIMAGIWPFVVVDRNVSRIWLHPAHHGSPGTLGYGALVLWALLAVLGVVVQVKASRKKIEVEAPKK